MSHQTNKIERNVQYMHTRGGCVKTETNMAAVERSIVQRECVILRARKIKSNCKEKKKREKEAQLCTEG